MGVVRASCNSHLAPGFGSESNMRKPQSSHPLTRRAARGGTTWRELKSVLMSRRDSSSRTSSLVTINDQRLL